MRSTSAISAATPASDGRTVRWGLLYRADGIHRIEGADLARVAALGIRTVLDLRTRGELDDHGRVATESIDAAYHHLPLLDQVWERDLPVAELDAVDFLAGRYLEMLDLGRELDRHRAHDDRPTPTASRSCSTARPARTAPACSPRSC